MPSGLRDAGGYTIGYRAQVLAYLLLVTERYPNSDPYAILSDVPAPPVASRSPRRRLRGLRRSRVTVFFRLPLVIPHCSSGSALWSVLAGLAVILQWFVTLVRRTPGSTSFHRFVSAAWSGTPSTSTPSARLPRIRFPDSRALGSYADRSRRFPTPGAAESLEDAVPGRACRSRVHRLGGTRGYRVHRRRS